MADQLPRAHPREHGPGFVLRGRRGGRRRGGAAVARQDRREVLRKHEARAREFDGRGAFQYCFCIMQSLAHVCCSHEMPRIAVKQYNFVARVCDFDFAHTLPGKAYILLLTINSVCARFC